MALFNRNGNKKDYDRYAPKKTGILLVLSTMWRELLNLITLNFTFDIFLMPVLFSGLCMIFLPTPVNAIISLILLLLAALFLPTALTAMSRITVTMVRDENCFVWKDFWDAWKKNCGKSLAGGLILNVALGLFILSFVVYRNIFGTNSFLMVIIGAFCACLGIIAVTAQMYFYPMTAYVDLPLKALLKNSLLLVMGSWKRSILGWLAIIPAAIIISLAFFGVAEDGTIVLTLLVGGGNEIALVFVLLVGFAVFSLCQSFALYPAILDKVIRKEERPAESLATGLHSREKIHWEEEELKSASVKDLDFGPDEEDSEDGKK